MFDLIHYFPPRLLATIGCGLVLGLTYILLEDKPRQVMTMRDGEQRYIPNTKDYIARLIGAYIVAVLAIIARAQIVFAFSVIAIATLVADTGFLTQIVALIWGRKEYWDYEQSRQQLLVFEDNTEEVREAAVRINAQDGETIDAAVRQVEEDQMQVVLLYHFERVYRLIYGSQLSLLLLLQASGEQGMSEQAVEEYYKGTPWYPQYPFPQYIGFLEQTYLIERKVETNSYILLPLGNDFIQYLKHNDIPTVKQPY